MWLYVLVVALGFSSLQIMVHQWHMSYVSWAFFMLILAGVFTFFKVMSAKEFAKRDKEFDEVKTLAAGFLGARHIHHPLFDISPFDLDNLIVSKFRTEKLFKNYYDYRFQHKYNSEIIALFLIIDSISMLINTGEYHDISNGYDTLNDKGNYFYSMYNDACEELEALTLFSEKDVENYLDKLDTLIEHVGYNLLSKN